MQTVYASPSKIITHESCGRRYHYQYVLKWKPEVEDANTAYGHSAHSGAETFLKAHACGRYESPVPVFIANWRATVGTQAIQYPQGWSAADMEHAGTQALQEFEREWYERDYQVMLDTTGEPIVESPITLDIGDGVIVRMVLDVVYQKPQGLIVGADLKTPRSEADEAFAHVAEQPTWYQIGVESTPRFGIDRIDENQFIELPKLKTKSRVTFDGIAPRRSEEFVREVIQKAKHFARDVRASYFPRRPMHSFQSPCKMCPYISHCIHGTLEGIDRKSVEESMQRHHGLPTDPRQMVPLSKAG